MGRLLVPGDRAPLLVGLASVEVAGEVGVLVAPPGRAGARTVAPRLQRREALVVHRSRRLSLLGHPHHHALGGRENAVHHDAFHVAVRRAERDPGGAQVGLRVHVAELVPGDALGQEPDRVGARLTVGELRALRGDRGTDDGPHRRRGLIRSAVAAVRIADEGAVLLVSGGAAVPGDLLDRPRDILEALELVFVEAPVLALRERRVASPEAGHHVATSDQEDHAEHGQEPEQASQEQAPTVAGLALVLVFDRRLGGRGVVVAGHCFLPKGLGKGQGGKNRLRLDMRRHPIVAHS